MYPYEYAEWNRLPEQIPGFMRTNKHCPACGSAGAFGATRSQHAMYCIDCGATWEIKEVIIHHSIYPGNSRYPDQRRHSYRSGWFQVWNLQVPAE